MMSSVMAVLFVLFAVTSAFNNPHYFRRSSLLLNMHCHNSEKMSKFFTSGILSLSIFAASTFPAEAELIAAPWNTGVKYEVVKTGTGPSAQIGSLVRT